MLDRRLSLVLVVLVFGTFAGQLLAITGPSVAQVPTVSLYSGRTPDSTTVQLTMQDRDRIVRFKIPKMYMTLSPNWAGGIQDIIALEVEFPSMSPAGKKGLVFSDIVAISLYSFANTGAHYDVSNLLQHNLQQEWTPVDPETDWRGQEYSLYVARSDIEKWKNRQATVREYLVPKDSSMPIFFGCYREKSNPLVGCTSYTNFGKSLSLEISFRRSQLQNWREILRASTGLLDSFKD
jgi:hypothetical protein